MGKTPAQQNRLKAKQQGMSHDDVKKQQSKEAHEIKTGAVAPPKRAASPTGGKRRQRDLHLALDVAAKRDNVRFEPEPFEEGEHLVQASAKLAVLDRLLVRRGPRSRPLPRWSHEVESRGAPTPTRACRADRHEPCGVRRCG